MKKITVIGVLLLSAAMLCLTACVTPKALEEAEPLRVGVSSTYPPLIFRSGRVSGVEADFARELASSLNRRLIWRELKWEKLIPSLLNGDIDIIMSGMSITEARKLQIAFSAPYLDTGQMALARHSSVARYNSPEKIKSSDARIGAQDGTTGDVFVQTQIPRATKVSVAKPESAMYFFDGNRIDLFIHDAPMVMWIASRHEADVAPVWHLLTKEQLAWGIRRDDGELLKAANELLAAMKKDGRLDKILSRWIPNSEWLTKSQ